MNQLTPECLQLIKDMIDCNLQATMPIPPDIDQFQRTWLMILCKEVLTTPEIYKAAGLVKINDELKST